jgi:hypothetical protein
MALTTPTPPKAKTPDEMFGTTDPTKQLGRDARSGVEQQIADISKNVGNVDQRLQQERTTREGGITREAETQRQKMARMFGIQSGGLQGGRAIRVAGTIGAQEAQAKEQLAGEFGQRVPQEQAQALGLLQGLQRGQEQADQGANVAASQIQLSDRAQAFSEYATGRQLTDAEFNSEVNRKVQNGELDIAERDQLLRQRAQVEAEKSGSTQRTLSVRAQEFSESMGLRQMTQTEANGAVERAVANGSISRDDADQILRARAQTEAEKSGTTQRDVQMRSMQDQEVNSAMDRAVKAGESTGVYTDPQTGMTRDTLQAELGRRQASVAERGITLQEASQSDDVRLREFALDLQDKIQSGQLTNEQARVALEGRQVKVQELTQEQAKITENARVAMENIRTQNDAATAAVERARINGEATGNYVDPQNGETIETLQARQLRLQTDLQDRQFDHQVAQDSQNVRLQDRGLDNQWQEIFMKDNISKGELAQRINEFTTTENRAKDEFKKQFDLTDEQFDEAKRKNLAGETLDSDRQQLALDQFESDKNFREKQFADQVEFRDAEAAFEKNVTRSVMTGQFDGKTTRAEADRLFKNGMEEAKLYGDEPPKILDLESMKVSFNAKKGDENYVADYDFNDDGVINFTDYGIMQQTGTDLGGGSRLISKPGRTTMAQKELIINSTQFQDELAVKLKGVTNEADKTKIEQQLANDSMTKFRDELALRKDDFARIQDEFASTFSGMLMKKDKNGNYNPEWSWDATSEKTDPVTGKVTMGQYLPTSSLQKQNFQQQTDRFNRDFNITAVDIATRIGALPQDDGVAIERFWDEVGNDDKIGSVKISGFLARELGIDQSKIKSPKGRSWWKKAIGGAVGYALGGPFGVIAGATLGAILDGGGDEGNIKEVWEAYVQKEAMKDPEYMKFKDTGDSEGAKNYKAKFSANKGREFLIGSLNEETMGAISGTMAQVVFQGQYAPTAPPPSQAASIIGGVAGQLVGGLAAAKSDINIKTDIFPLKVKSDIAIKDDITNIANGDDVLERLDDMPVSTWRYKTEPSNVRHLGPMAQDFKRIFNLGDSDKTIHVVDGMGVALTASKQLSNKFKALSKRMKALEQLATGGR